MTHESSPSRRFCKPVLGRVVLAADDARHDYIDAGRRPDGSRYYVLDAWRSPGRPRVVSEIDVRAVEPFARPTC